MPMTTVEPLRAQLQSNLAAYFHSQPVAAPSGYPSWSASGGGQAGQAQQKLLVGDPVTLMVSLNIPHTHTTTKNQRTHTALET